MKQKTRMATFEDLQGLADLISRNKVKNIQVIGNPNAPNTKFEQFYQGLVNHEWAKEEEAEIHFYGPQKNKAAFDKLKSRLHDRMINTLFFIDVNQPNFTDSQKAYYNCYKNAATVKILLGRYGREHAIPLAIKTLGTALYFEFTDIALNLAKDLRTHFGTIIGDDKKSSHYNRIVQTQSRLYMAELKAEEHYSSLISNFVSSKSTKPELIKIAQKYSEDLQGLLQENDSFRLNFLFFLVFTLRYELENNYVGTLEVSKSAIQYFKQRKIPASPNILWNFWMKKLQCYIQLSQYNSAEEASKKCITLPPLGANNWFSGLNYSMILFFHYQKFNKAFEIYQQATTNNKYKKLPPSYSEPWRIHEAFIFYFIRIGKIDVSNQKKLKTFRINKFLNEMPTYSKDKYGINITILILHVLFLLLDGRYGEIIDRMESLNTYTHRYLRKDHTFRSNCFIKMLLQLPAASFHKEAVIRKAKKFKDKLESVPLEEANQSVEIEIVPYEMLWEFVLDSLDNKFHHTNKKL